MHSIIVFINQFNGLKSAGLKSFFVAFRVVVSGMPIIFCAAKVRVIRVNVASFHLMTGHFSIINYILIH